MEVKTKKVKEQCPHCGSAACHNGAGYMGSYWVAHRGCDAARAERGLAPLERYDSPNEPLTPNVEAQQPTFGEWNPDE